MVQDQLNGDKSEETKYDPAQPSMFEKMIRTKQAEKRYTKEQKVWHTQVKPGLCIAKTCFHQDATYDRLARQDAGGEPWVKPDLEGFKPNAFPSLSDDGRTLKTSAAVVDAVRFRLPVDGNWSASGGFCFWPVIRPYFIDKLGPDSIYKHTGERISTAFWRTLMDDMWNKKHPAPDRFEQYFAQCLAKLEGPAKARTQVPYLFREHMVKENSWMLIGETYVHGIMHGEALRKGLAFDPIDIV
ncbi:Heterokaryon incompatibility protein [Lasiodiplodia theobromae]|uniref:Heterokaryon incompatibility protein n=1 Tax=Lasiodiplodia theobromae TaxID=45133 RepID=UPI0015C2ED4D|nr:Heterokaryon incompatibility protein [Lasiodiplodia theobromae]KAF4545929.1 Heterokaryon incompatibility protein [Lasiodiplodia theobromae]